MRLFSLLLFIVLCCACEGNTAARKAARGPNFVSDPDHLYFKNTRIRHYQAEEVTNRATIFRHEALYNSDAQLRLVLIDNWLQDRALIRFELLPEIKDWHLEVHRANNQAEQLLFSDPPSNEYLDSLATILLGKDELYVRSRTDTIFPAFPNGAGRAAARTVILDYLRLVGH